MFSMSINTLKIVPGGHDHPRRANIAPTLAPANPAILDGVVPVQPAGSPEGRAEVVQGAQRVHVLCEQVRFGDPHGPEALAELLHAEVMRGGALIFPGRGGELVARVLGGACELLRRELFLCAGSAASNVFAPALPRAPLRRAVTVIRAFFRHRHLGVVKSHVHHAQVAQSHVGELEVRALKELILLDGVKAEGAKRRHHAAAAAPAPAPPAAAAAPRSPSPARAPCRSCCGSAPTSGTGSSRSRPGRTWTSPLTVRRRRTWCGWSCHRRRSGSAGR